MPQECGVRVVARFRPFNEREKKDSENLTKPPEYKIASPLINTTNNGNYCFDAVLDSGMGQAETYDQVPSHTRK